MSVSFSILYKGYRSVKSKSVLNSDLKEASIYDSSTSGNRKIEISANVIKKSAYVDLSYYALSSFSGEKTNVSSCKLSIVIDKEKFFYNIISSTNLNNADYGMAITVEYGKITVLTGKNGGYLIGKIYPIY